MKRFTHILHLKIEKSKASLSLAEAFPCNEGQYLGSYGPDFDQDVWVFGYFLGNQESVMLTPEQQGFITRNKFIYAEIKTYVSERLVGGGAYE